MAWLLKLNIAEMLGLLAILYIVIDSLLQFLSPISIEKIKPGLEQWREEHAKSRRLKGDLPEHNKAIFAEIAREYIERDSLDDQTQ